MRNRAPRPRLIALAIATGLTLGGACADDAPADPTGQQALAVLGGAVDTTHDAVVSILTVPSAAFPELCTGVLVAPRVVLTAGHCLASQTIDSLTVGFGGSAQHPTSSLAVAAIDLAPGFTDDLAFDEQHGHDLGAIVLASDAPVAPLALVDAAASFTVGEAVSIVGFGLDDASDEESSGTRRVGSSTIEATCSALLVFGSTGNNACHGDSGAPLLVVGGDGVERLAGVVSWGRTDACDPPSYAMRVDAYREWIGDLEAGSADASCASCPTTADDCPPSTSPPTDAAIGDGTTGSDAEPEGSDVDPHNDAPNDAIGDETASSEPAPRSSSGGCRFSSEDGVSPPLDAVLPSMAALVGLARLRRRRSGACSRSGAGRRRS